MKLILIRHGEPDYSIDSLTEKGWREAELLAERVKKWEVTQFFVSPLGRALDTAKASMEKTGRFAITLPWLKEFDAPIEDPVTGEKRIPWDFLPDYFDGQDLLYHKDTWLESPVMQTGRVEKEYRIVTRELDKLLFYYGYQREGNMYRVLKGTNDTLVMFCHFGVSMVILSHLAGISASALWQGFYMSPSSVTVLCTQERREGEAVFRCKSVGDISHLYAAGEKPSDSGFFQETWRY